jgi:hypothetical protein
MSQNSGVRCEAVDDATGEISAYFGFIDDIWEVEYGPRLQIPVFRCRWVQDKHVTVDNYGQRILDLSKVGYKDDPWILANRAAQVFYVEQILSQNEKKSTKNPNTTAQSLTEAVVFGFLRRANASASDATPQKIGNNAVGHSARLG